MRVQRHNQVVYRGRHCLYKPCEPNHIGICAGHRQGSIRNIHEVILRINDEKTNTVHWVFLEYQLVPDRVALLMVFQCPCHVLTDYRAWVILTLFQSAH